MKVLAVVLVPDYMPEPGLVLAVVRWESARDSDNIRLATNEDIAKVLMGDKEYWKVEG